MIALCYIALTTSSALLLKIHSSQLHVACCCCVAISHRWAITMPFYSFLIVIIFCCQYFSNNFFPTAAFIAIINANFFLAFHSSIFFPSMIPFLIFGWGKLFSDHLFITFTTARYSLYKSSFTSLFWFPIPIKLRSMSNIVNYHNYYLW